MGLVSWSTETHSYRDSIRDYRGYIRIMEKNGKLLSCNGVCIYIYEYERFWQNLEPQELEQ